MIDMAEIKTCTYLSQSRKLAKILPLESADMVFTLRNGPNSPIVFIKDINELDVCDVPCWSLTALLSVLPDNCGINKENGKYVASYILSPSNECGAYTKDNPIDACYEMILYLHEKNLL